MKISFIIRISVCVFVFGLCLCAYIDKQNEVTRCKIAIPKLQSEIDTLSMQTQKLIFIQRDVFTLEEGFAVLPNKEEKTLQCSPTPTVSLASRMGH